MPVILFLGTFLDLLVGIRAPKLKAEAPARPKTTYKEQKADKTLESHIEKSAPAPCVPPFNIIKGQASCSGSPCFHWFGEDVLCADPPFWTRIPPGSPPDPPVDPPLFTLAACATKDRYAHLFDVNATICHLRCQQDRQCASAGRGTTRRRPVPH